MTLTNRGLLPGVSRHPFQPNGGPAVVVMTPGDDVVLVGLFLDDEFVHIDQ
jgi:hypothetical protein